MKFKSVEFKNILSYGNKLTKLPLDTNQTIGITGINGHGKSVLLDVLHFVLTGKPYRKKLKKLELINRLNKKDCYGKLILEHNGKDVIIERGIKPDIFNIIVDGKSLDEDSKSIDQQKWLSQFLNINTANLRHTLFISSTNYNPFLQMTLSEKRLFIEDLLNIEIFGNILKNLKAKVSIIKESIKDCETKIEKFESNIEVIVNMLKSLNESNADKIKELKKELQDLKDSCKNYKTEQKELEIVIENTNKEIEELTEERKIKIEEKEELQEKYTKQQTKIRDFKEKGVNSKVRVITKLEGKQERFDFFDNNDVCPTCQQDIDSEYSEEISTKLKNSIDELKDKENSIKDKLTKLDLKSKKLDKLYDKIQNLSDKVMNIDSSITQNNNKINMANRDINNKDSHIKTNKNRAKRIKEEIEELKNPKKVEVNDDRKDINKRIKKEKKSLTKYQNTMKAYDLAFKLLSDKGIKQYIIKKYIPLLNKFINLFLEIFQADYRIKFDDELKETIIKGYTKCSYYSLSAGEKARADLSILFAFLNIAKSRNYVSSNILILDEVADANLDKDGLDGLIEILNKLKEMGYTTFTISHRKELEDKFEKSYIAEKTRFSKLIEK